MTDSRLQLVQRFPVLRGASRVLPWASLPLVVVLAIVAFGPSSNRSLVALPAEATGEIAIDVLEGAGIGWSRRDGRLLVSLQDEDEALAAMERHGLLSPTPETFDELIRNGSLFMTSRQLQVRQRVATQHALAEMITQLAPVRRATVLLAEPGGPTGLGLARGGATASVTVVPERGELDEDTVEAIAQIVAGSSTLLRPEAVAIVDAGSGRVRHAGGSPREFAESTTGRPAIEQRARMTLRDALGYIPGLRIAVNVPELDDPAGPLAPVAVSASIGVPRDWIVQRFRAQHGRVPEETEIEALGDRTRQEIHDTASLLLSSPGVVPTIEISTITTVQPGPIDPIVSPAQAVASPTPPYGAVVLLAALAGLFGLMLLHRRTSPSVPSSTAPGPLARLRSMEPGAILEAVRDEPPATVAIIVASLPHDRAVALLEGLPVSQQGDVAHHVATMDEDAPRPPSGDVVEAVTRVARRGVGIPG